MFDTKNKRIRVLNCPIDVLTLSETLALIDASIREKKRLHHMVVNAAKLVNCSKDKKLRESVVNCDIINADGQGVVWAAKLLNQPLPERVAGIDIMFELVALSKQKGYKIYFLGAKEEVVRRTVERFASEYGPEVIAGYRNGYFSTAEEKEVAEEIGRSGADILFVAISSPKKEIFLNSHKHAIQAPFIMGVGGSFDVASGLVKRAPLFMQKAGMEWFYRFIQEPRKMWKRAFVTNLEFAWMVIRERFRGAATINDPD